ncbi:MAG: inositol monophosphatase [Gammaproteobacteria bacterium]|nr:MAG: inositol monophosphatase [Gammaproteobacteria bacterium]
MMTTAVRAARAAADYIVRASRRLDNLQISEKGPNDFVSEVDQQAELRIIETIHKAYPDHAILAEESGEQGKHEYQWIIDPLDGTTNFLHGYPCYSVSIAVRLNGRLEHGVVYDPNLDELFCASRGNGAMMNNRRIRVARRANLRGALLATGFPFRSDQNLEQYMKTLQALIKKTSGIRRPGSAALDLAYLAAGRVDGFWEFGLRPWDTAAGALLVQEAGGLVSDMRGGHDFLESGDIVAANPKVLREILTTIRPYLA